MADPVDHSAEIARIRELLNTGARQITVDGETVILDPDMLRRRLAELQAGDSVDPVARPRVRSFDLSRAW